MLNLQDLRLEALTLDYDQDDHPRTGEPINSPNGRLTIEVFADHDGPENLWGMAEAELRYDQGEPCGLHVERIHGYRQIPGCETQDDAAVADQIRAWLRREERHLVELYGRMTYLPSRWSRPVLHWYRWQDNRGRLQYDGHDMVHDDEPDHAGCCTGTGCDGCLPDQRRTA